jgi:hypothetical protein
MVPTYLASLNLMNPRIAIIPSLQILQEIEPVNVLLTSISASQLFPGVMWVCCAAAEMGRQGSENPSG